MYYLKFICLGLIYFCFSSSIAQVFSDFPNTTSGVDGWTAPSSLANAITYNNVGGNPNGFVSAIPTTFGTVAIFPGYFYFTAPAKFLGNFSAYLNGSISFDLKQGTFTTATSVAEVIISNGASSIYYFPPSPFNPPTASWGNYALLLNNASGYWKTANASTATVATQANIQAILANVTYFGIRGRFNGVFSPGATGLDNVFLQPPITITTQPTTQSICLGGGVVNLSTTTSVSNGLTYQWSIFNPTFNQFSSLSNSTIYSNVSTPTLTINTALGGAGIYKCTITAFNSAQIVDTQTATVTINPLPAAPTTTNPTSCGSLPFVMTATGGTNGQYRWYTVATGGTAIAGEVNSSYTTPLLTNTTTYYVSINNGTCESPRTPSTATIITTGCTPPSIAVQALATPVGGIITLNLIPLISTPNSTLNINSIQIITNPSSGAIASISSGILTLNYKGITFTGKEQLTIRACNANGACANQTFSIDVAGDIIVYNAISPNGANPRFILDFIDLIPETKSNMVTIFDRWQNEVWRGENYNNTSVVFKGAGESGNDLPTGTYFYKIEFASGKKMKTGFISLKR